MELVGSLIALCAGWSGLRVKDIHVVDVWDAFDAGSMNNLRSVITWQLAKRSRML
jgi:hypothetical protein